MRVARIVYCIQDSLEDQPQAEGTFPVQIKIYLSIAWCAEQKGRCA